MTPLEQAEQIASNQGPDEAAKFLASFRRETVEALHHEQSQFGILLSIVTAQIKYLNLAEKPDKAAQIAEWFLHLMHHLEEESPQIEWSKVRSVLRESFSAFFRYYARSLRDLDRMDEMRIAMRNAMDLTGETEMAIVYLIHLYSPLIEMDKIEQRVAREWLLDRYAECLAALDFAGKHNTPFRALLDQYQLSIRMPDNRTEILETIKDIAVESDDVASATLKSFIHHTR